MKIITYPALVAALALAGCSQDSSESTAKVAVTDAAETAAVATVAAAESELGQCLDSGPQTPRDISSKLGLNLDDFEMAPPASEMSLCNIHTHTNAEHKAPGFSVFVSDQDEGGYACNETSELTAAELVASPGAYQGVSPGDTIEVHWVHTSCDSNPGPGLGACVPASCENPLLRVEAQAFLVVNDGQALDFNQMAYGGNRVDGRAQAKLIPTNTGKPVVFRGSTTGPSYDQQSCSSAQVTWSVRPQCAKLDINSLHLWAESGNAFEETKSHGVRQLVTAPELLSPIN